MRHRFFWMYLVFLGSHILVTQAQQNFIFPLKGAISLNGNYGEVRPNHFHAGLDFRTHPSEHMPVYAVADGYVSRIKISSYGYGKVLYITHPNGLVSVYGHQFGFSPVLKKYVEAAQEMAEVFEIELFPKAHELPVKQGELIGYSGNTGSSEGPHLHFEIRNEKTEAPLNPLRFLKVKDVVAPKIQRIAIYSKTSVEKIFVPKKIIDTLIQNKPLAFGVECFDFEQAQGSKNNIYKAEIYIDNILFYRHVLDSIPFDLAKYVNTYADYELKKRKQISIQKLFREKNNNLPIYKVIHGDGFIQFADEAFHQVRLVVYDFYNQSDEVSFIMKSKLPFSENSPPEPNAQNCLEPFQTSSNDYRIELPAGSLYRDIVLAVQYKNGKLVFEGKGYDIPFQNTCIVRLKVPEKWLKYQDKLCISVTQGHLKTFADAVV